MQHSSYLLCVSAKRLWVGLVLTLAMASMAGAQESDTEPAAASGTATTDTASAPSRSKVQEQSLERLLPATQQRRLDIDDQAFLGLFLPAAQPKALGSIILIAGQDEHADWPVLIGPARRQLSAEGWHTLAISLPERGYAAPGLGDEQSTSPELQYRTQVLARIQAARQVLEAEGGADKDLPIVLLGRGEGALWALIAAAETGSPPTAALILQDLPVTAEGETTSTLLLEQWAGPTYDILISPAEHAEARKLQARRLAHNRYQQLIWPQSGHSELKQQMLIKRLGGWLKRALSETPGNA
ncbi:DUF3530 family protein [Halopseudomonas pelagia]|uniref:DUF3530 family protein n=1 Tax=Halopseudomonas pelagia TaxID=553151 RepID=A0AA91Z5M6_9GAMM|nr:DUF3530 family protein [Halopseudomonas pelagia]PCC98809.1 hypothetical protein CO192_13110 [Halopseudomonas pelagia]QFY58360.1 DUF3530 family protein [Halopseudomonas pelagia]